MAKKRVIGASRLRRKLARIPEEVDEGLRQTIRDGANAALEAQRAAAPYDADSDLKDWEGKPRGHLRDQLEARISKNGLFARIGLMGKNSRKVFFFAKFLIFGTKHIAKRDFIWRPWIPHREEIRRRVRDRTVAALERVANSRPSDA